MRCPMALADPLGTLCPDSLDESCFFDAEILIAIGRVAGGLGRRGSRCGSDGPADAPAIAAAAFGGGNGSVAAALASVLRNPRRAISESAGLLIRGPPEVWPKRPIRPRPPPPVKTGPYCQIRRPGLSNRSFGIQLDHGPHVRFGSKADIRSAICHVRFTPNSDRKSRHVPRKRPCPLNPESGHCSPGLTIQPKTFGNSNWFKWRTQSQSNLSLHPNSLICGNLQGIFAICREFGLETHRKEPPDQAVTAKIPYATDQRIFRSGSGILEARAANLPQPEILPWPVLFRPLRRRTRSR